MSVLDTLEIVVSGDYSSLQSALMGAQNTISSFISKVSTQKIDWSKLFGGQGSASQAGSSTATKVASQKMDISSAVVNIASASSNSATSLVPGLSTSSAAAGPTELATEAEPLVEGLGSLLTPLLTALPGLIATALTSIISAGISGAITNQQSSQTNAVAGVTGNAATGSIAGAQTIAMSTGQNQQDIQKAINDSTGAFNTQADAITYVTEAADLAAEGYGNFNDIISSTLPIMTQFGITTGPAATTMMNELMTAASGAKMTVNDFATSFSQFIPALKLGGTNASNVGDAFSTFSGIIEAFGGGANGLPTAESDFTALADAVSKGGDPITTMAGGMDKLRADIADGKMGLAMKAIADAATTIAGTAGGMQEVEQAFGLTVKQANDLIDTKDKWKTIMDNTQTIAGNIALAEEGVGTINDRLSTQITFLTQLAKLWATVSVAMQGGVAQQSTSGQSDLGGMAMGGVTTPMMSGNVASSLNDLPAAPSDIDTLVAKLSGAIISGMQTASSTNNSSTTINQKNNISIPAGQVGSTTTDLYNSVFGSI